MAKISSGLKKKRGSKAKAILADENKEYMSYYKKAKHRLPKKEVLDKSAYLTAVAGEEARGRTATPGSIVKRQVNDGLTDAQIDVRWKVVQQYFPEKYRFRGEFVKNKGWEDVEVIAAQVKADLEAQGLDASDAVVYRHIYSPGL